VQAGCEKKAIRFNPTVKQILMRNDCELILIWIVRRCSDNVVA